MSSKKLLITGGAGFIGSAVIRHIINNTNHSVVNVDKLTYAGNLESLKSIESDARYSFERVDICNGDSIKLVFKTYFNGSLQNGFGLLIPYLISERELSEPIMALISPWFITSSNSLKKIDLSPSLYKQLSR
jgi:hypothetical protein